MGKYEEQIGYELQFWKMELMKKPSALGGFAEKIQHKINGYIPAKVHKAITVAIKQMVKAVLFGSTYTTSAIPDP